LIQPDLILIIIFRVAIPDEPRLPQNVCIECRESVQSFIKFCETVDKTQKDMKNGLPFNVQPIKEEILEFSPPPSPPLSTIVKTPPAQTLISNLDLPKDSPFALSDFETPQFNDDHLFDDFHLNSEVPRSSHESTPVPSLKALHQSTPVSARPSEEKDMPPRAPRENIESMLAKMKPCSVNVYNLPIKYVLSDDSDSENDVTIVGNGIDQVSLQEDSPKNNNNYKKSFARKSMKMKKEKVPIPKSR
jgi:hypothetical protein